MLVVRKANERGETNLGWLKSRHTFSFNMYHDPKNVHFRQLRVLNNDIITPKDGFDMHSHNDLEMLTFIYSGKLEYKDSLGNSSLIQVGDILRMTAGSGIMHSEFNPSENEDVHMYQIWIFPDKKGLEPSYEQVSYNRTNAVGNFLLLASQEKKKDTLRINQDMSLYLSILPTEEEIEFAISQDRYIWIQVVSGELIINGIIVSTGDGVAVVDETLLKLHAIADSEILLFDLK